MMLVTLLIIWTTVYFSLINVLFDRKNYYYYYGRQVKLIGKIRTDQTVPIKKGARRSSCNH